LFRFFIAANLVNNLLKIVITFTCTQAIYWHNDCIREQDVLRNRARFAQRIIGRSSY
jgi:hypothetical protein